VKLISQRGGTRIYQADDGQHIEVRAQSRRVRATTGADVISGYPEVIRAVRSTLLKNLDDVFIKEGLWDPHDTITLGNDEPVEAYTLEGESLGMTITFWAERGFWPQPIDPTEGTPE
jgi:hypothetical protein